MAKKVRVKVLITQLVKSQVVKPNSPLFSFFNDGDYGMGINQSYVPRPGDSFGFNGDALVGAAILNDLVVENDTSYNIFISNLPGRNSAQLIEVHLIHDK